MTPATMTKLVIMYINTITVLIEAILSASLLVAPDFSPSAFAQILQIFNPIDGDNTFQKVLYLD